MQHSSTQHTDPTKHIELIKHAVIERLNRHYESRIQQAAVVGESYVELWQSAFSQHAGGGKRLRPFLAMLAYEAFGGTNQQAMLDVACALELLHTALLMHDDVMDDDFTRHGKHNISGVYALRYQAAKVPKTRAKHYGHSAALLAGDALISDSYQLITASGFTAQQKVAAVELLGEIIFLVGGGQFLDSEATLQPIESVDCFKIARFKTASYSFVGPLSMGAVLAGATESSQRHLQSFGENIGIAFQIVDDILGIYGDEKTLGKSVLSDIQEGKRTLLIQYAQGKLSKPQAIKLKSILGNNKATAKDAAFIKELLVSTGAKAYAEQQVLQYKNAALKSLNQLDLPEPIKVAFETIAERATNRLS